MRYILPEKSLVSRQTSPSLECLFCSCCVSCLLLFLSFHPFCFYLFSPLTERRRNNPFLIAFPASVGIPFCFSHRNALLFFLYDWMWSFDCLCVINTKVHGVYTERRWDWSATDRKREKKTREEEDTFKERVTKNIKKTRWKLTISHLLM